MPPDRKDILHRLAEARDDLRRRHPIHVANRMPESTRMLAPDIERERIIRSHRLSGKQLLHVHPKPVQ